MDCICYGGKRGELSGQFIFLSGDGAGADTVIRHYDSDNQSKVMSREIASFVDGAGKTYSMFDLRHRYCRITARRVWAVRSSPHNRLSTTVPDLN